MKGSSVLVVDDQAHLRRILRVHLERAGHDVEEAGDGVQALERLRANSVQLVVADVTMPNMDGHELCEQIVAEWGDEGPPVIVLTAVPHEDCRWAEELGAVLLSKPVSIRQLLNAIEEVVGKNAEGES